MDDDRGEVKREVRRYAAEFGVSLAQAWAERKRWEAEHAIDSLVRKVLTSEATERCLDEELRSVRKDLHQHRRALVAARRKRDAAIAKVDILRNALKGEG